MSSPSLRPPTALERVAGSRTAEGALTAIGALAGGPLAALLPVLGKSLAAERQKLRVEAALAEIDKVLNEHSEALNSLSDAQYKLVNEAVLALLHTTAEEKIAFLKSVVRNAISVNSVNGQEAVVLSRIIRDISADEATFLCASFAFDRIQVTSADAKHEMKVLNVRPGTPDALVVTGLVSLGILEAAEPTWDEGGLLRYSTVTAKLIALLGGAP
jgi:flagellar hook-associated protein FlgK